MTKYAIVGFGCAGYHAAKAIREHDSQSEIHVFDATCEPPANPMLTTYFVADKISKEGVYPFGTLDDIIRDLDIQFHGNNHLSHIDSQTKILHFTDGKSFQFDKLLIATGAVPFVPPIKQTANKPVFLMRTLDDARQMKAYLANNQIKTAVVIGASMVGIKVAELLNNRGVKTTIADMAEYLFPLAAFKNVGQEFERRATAKGLSFLWNASITDINENGAVFNQTEEVPADIVCLCIGTRANIPFINKKSIDKNVITVNRAIVVNTQMQTSDPDIYAAGDCCEGNNLQTNDTSIIGLWANAAYQGNIAGQNMAGNTSHYDGNIVHNITHFMDMDFIGLGDTRLEGESHTFGDIQSDNYIKAVIKDRKLQCVNIIGNYKASGIIKSQLIKQINNPNASLSILQKGVLIQAGIPTEFVNLIE